MQTACRSAAGLDDEPTDAPSRGKTGNFPAAGRLAHDPDGYDDCQADSSAAAAGSGKRLGRALLVGRK